MRDLTQKQFSEAVKRNGFTSQGFLGYYDLGIPGRSFHVSALNAGTNRRAQLAYLLDQRRREIKRLEREERA